MIQAQEWRMNVISGWILLNHLLWLHGLRTAVDTPTTMPVTNMKSQEMERLWNRARLVWIVLLLCKNLNALSITSLSLFQQIDSLKLVEFACTKKLFCHWSHGPITARFGNQMITATHTKSTIQKALSSKVVILLYGQENALQLIKMPLASSIALKKDASLKKRYPFIWWLLHF